ncbi:hypothetical protein D1007_01594 [Hordeum vulgare]|nr:hypothetical protein D1007_01594 [Hordeum vulgare]
MDDDQSSEHGRTLIWPSARAKQPASKEVYPFFLHSVFGGLVPPFSSFFTAILNHYGIQALHLQYNSILLLSVFAVYYEAFVGMRPLVALFRHFFSLRLHDAAHLSACVSFIAAQGGNLLLKAGKKVEIFRHRWVLMSFKDAHPRLEVPKGLPEKISTWSSMKVYDPRAVPILERFSRGISAHPGALRVEELNRVVVTLLGGNPGDLPKVVGPLYCLDDRADLIATLLVFDERGLSLAEGSTPVEVSSGDTSSGEGSKKTVDDCPASAPLPSQVILLHELEDDDVTGEFSAVMFSHLTRISGGPVLSPRAMQSMSRPWRILPPPAGSLRGVASLGAKKKKAGVKPKATPDTPPTLPNASPPTDEEWEAQEVTSQTLVAKPREPQKRPEVVVVAAFPEGQALEGPQSTDAPMLTISEQPSEPLSLVMLPP